MMVLFQLVGFIGASHGQDVAHHFQGCSRSEYANQPYLTEKVTHSVCSSMCYQADYSLYMMKSKMCLCTEWNLTFYDGHSDCKVLCEDDLNKYCGTDEIGAVYSVCGKLSWGHGCQMNCMCESEFCDIVEGKCTTGKCMPGFRGERCDWWDETLLEGFWSLTIRSYLKEALELGIISKTGEYLSPIHKICPAGLYGRACTMKCHCFNSSECIQATGLCPPKGCQPGWVGKRCDREAPCDPSKCINGGKCIVKSRTAYLCQCPQTFVGVHCEYRNPCLSSPCHNRGTCSNVGLFFKCLCPQNFAGELCDIVVPDSWYTNVSTQLLGCYRNLLNVAINLDLRTLVDHKFMDKDRCVTFCRGKDYTFAGIEEGSICYCASMFIFNQFGAVWSHECNSTCSGQLSSSVSECGGEGLVTVYTTCPVNRWGQNCNEMCMCTTGQCDIMTGLCRRPGICQFGWTGGKCNEELSVIDKMQFSPCVVLSLLLALLMICLSLLAFYYLIYLPSEEFDKLVKLAEFEFDVEEDLKKTKTIWKIGGLHDNGRE